MRYILLLWFAPLALFWGWYGLSAYDINMGMVFFSRNLHDAVFAIYGDTLGVAPEKIPPMIAGASIVDSAIIGAIAAFRWRANWFPQVKAWVIERYSRYFGEESTVQLIADDDVTPIDEAPEFIDAEPEPTPTSLKVGPALPAE